MKGMIEVIHYPTKEKFEDDFTKTVKIKSFEQSSRICKHLELRVDGVIILNEGYN